MHNNKIFVESWDNANNKSIDSLKVNMQSDINNSDIINIYNFPNPFSDRTFFTYQVIDLPYHEVHTEVTIYNQNGILLKRIKNIQLNNFISIEWDGKDSNSNLVSNGTYLYTLNEEDCNVPIFLLYHDSYQN